ncbi:O1509 protein, partial [Corvus moneduloides]|nr:O1509 protein [Corvus moneduloides]
NSSRVKEFILLGLSENRGVQKIYFVVFLLFYTLTVAGNLLIVLTVMSSRHLNSPMYFFLCHLSFVDVCYSSVTAPQMISGFLVENNTISFAGCIGQLFGFHFFGCTEIFILTAMAYDRYAAICRPLHYPMLMSRRLACWALVAACWAGGFIHSIIQTLLVLQLPFCGPNMIHSYFCDVLPVVQLACTNTALTEWLMASNSGLISLGCFLVLVASYALILAKVRGHLSQGHWKALSTCASHLMVVTLVFVPCIFTYLRPAGTLPSNKYVCVIYTTFSPMMNPLIYTLRSNEVKESMWRLWKLCRA